MTANRQDSKYAVRHRLAQMVIAEQVLGRLVGLIKQSLAFDYVAQPSSCGVDIFPPSADNACPIPPVNCILTTGLDGAGTRNGFSMAYVLYRDHTIVSSAVYDDITGEWKLNACVSWQASGDRIQFLKNSVLTFARFEEAEIAGIEYSKTWIDKKLSSSVSL